MEEKFTTSCLSSADAGVPMKFRICPNTCAVSNFYDPRCPNQQPELCAHKFAADRGSADVGSPLPGQASNALNPDFRSDWIVEI
jgi:hypothetical protein